MNIRDDFILKELKEGFLVGGSVRDFLLGKENADRDIAIKGAEDFAKKLPKNLMQPLLLLTMKIKFTALF